jgi:hypothetical protein
VAAYLAGFPSAASMKMAEVSFRVTHRTHGLPIVRRLRVARPVVGRPDSC